MADIDNDTKHLETQKQKAIEEIIEEATKWKNILYAEIQKIILNRYLTTDWNWREKIEDNLIEGVLWKETITDAIKESKKKLAQVRTNEELNSIKASTIASINKTRTTDTSVATTSSTSRRQNSRAQNTTRTSRTQSTPAVSGERYELSQFNIYIPDRYKELYNQLTWEEKPELEPFACAMKCYEEQKSSLKNTKYLTIVDFAKPSDENRFYVINMDTKSIEYATTVWHWKWSWRWKWATSFSNISGSNQSSLWLFRISSVYENNTKKTRRWLRMYPTSEDNNNNWNAASRWIFLHPWTNNSKWCFTIPKNISSEILEKVKGWWLFAYAKYKDYFAKSDYFNTNSNWDVSLAA